MQDFDAVKTEKLKWSHFVENRARRGSLCNGKGLFFEDLQTLAGLPLLVGEFAGRGIEEVVIISRRLLFPVQCIVCCGPEEESRCVFRRVP